jgi:hypothetical protein
MMTRSSATRWGPTTNPGLSHHRCRLLGVALSAKIGRLAMLLHGAEEAPTTSATRAVSHAHAPRQEAAHALRGM